MGAVEVGTVWASLGWSAVYAGVIGAAAVLLAMPSAWAMRIHRRDACATVHRLVGVLSWVPMLMPAYLAYAALTTLRSPKSWLGDVLATCDPWWSIAAGRAMAVVGLALWGWPIALLVLAPSVARIEPSVLDVLKMDTGWWGRKAGGVRTIWAMTWRGVLVAWLAVAVVMIGSAVPLHLAQVPTAATRVWLLMSLTTDPARIWSAAWPLVVIAVAAAALMVRVVAGASVRAEPGFAETGANETKSAWIVRAGALLIALVSILLPIVLMASAVKHWSTVTGFWEESGPAVASSVIVAAVVGGVCAALCAAAWFAASCGGVARRAVLVLGGVAVAAGLTPGVLVGQAVGYAYGWLEGDVVGMAGVVVAHTARFGCVGVLAGVYLAGLESSQRRAARLIDGATGWRGWGRTVLMDTTAGRGWLMLLGVGLIAACLSFHEIEATVMVLPPGGRALAQQLLEQLHYLRDEHLGAAVINVMGAATLVGVLAAWLAMGRGASVRRHA